MTNGEKVLANFPNVVTRVWNNNGFTYIGVEMYDKWIADISIEWWNSECEEPTTKNEEIDKNKS